MFQLPCPLRIAAVAFTLSLAAAKTPAAEPFSPAPAPLESFDARTLHVDKFGSGAQTLVLIPGLVSGPWVWYDTIKKFAPTYTIYAITLPGFDGRPATNEKPLFTVFARDFWAMLAAHKIQNPIVIGHSLGGTLAIALAEEHPERLSGIIAVDGLPVFPTLAYANSEQREAMASEMTKNLDSSTKEDELAGQKNYMSTIGTNKPELVEPAARLLSRSDPKAIAAWMREDLANDLRPNLSKITTPFLEIMPYDPADAKPPFAYTQEQTLAFYKSILAGAPKAIVVTVAPSRHFVMLDQPDAFYKAVADFLSSIHH